MPGNAAEPGGEWDFGGETSGVLPEDEHGVVEHLVDEGLLPEEPGKVDRQPRRIPRIEHFKRLLIVRRDPTQKDPVVLT